MGRTAWNVKINWHDRACAIQNLRVAYERPARDGAGSDGDDDFWFGNRIPRFRQGVTDFFGIGFLA